MKYNVSFSGYVEVRYGATINSAARYLKRGTATGNTAIKQTSTSSGKKQRFYNNKSILSAY